jgi:hypothetical protein
MTFIQSRAHLQRAVFCFAVTLTALFSAPSVKAQAWLQPKGEGAFSLTYSHFDGGDHLFSTDAIDGLTSRGYEARGNRWFLGDTFSHNLQLELDYSISNQLAVTTGLAFVRAKYEGNAPVNTDIDNGLYHGGVQDFSVKVRAAVIERIIAVTPFVALSVPMKSYESYGHSAIGRHLYEIRSGIFLGWAPSNILRGSFAQAQFMYGWLEAVGNVRVKHAALDVEAGYYVSRRISVSALISNQRTYGGHEWISGDPTQPGGHGSGTGVGLDIATSAARFTRLGWSTSYAVRSDLGLYGSYVTTVWGQNVDDANFVVLGITYNFRTPWSEYRRAHR